MIFILIKAINFYRKDEKKWEIPSPWSLARKTMKTYLVKGINVKVYKIKDKTPMTSSLCFIPSVNVLANTYNGDVPMSPYTTPMLWNASCSTTAHPMPPPYRARIQYN